ncbi:MAG: hypothetical protein AAGD22_10420 [Verrucomicrobiota bacterium]
MSSVHSQKNDPVAQMEAAARLSTRSVTLIVSLFVIFTAVFAVLLWKKTEIKDAIGDYRSNRLIEKALTAKATGSVEEAKNLLFDAYVVHPKNPEILRELRRLDPEDKDNASWLYLLHTRNHSTIEEHIELVERMVSLGNFKQTRKIAQSLAERAPNNPRALRAISAATELKDINDRQQLETLLQNASEFDPNDRMIKFERARTKLMSPILDVQKVGASTIMKLAETDSDSVSLRALRFIAMNRKSFSSAVYPKLLERYQNHPLINEVDEPLVFGWELEVSSQDAPKLVRAALADWQNSLSPDELADRLFWLINNNQAQGVLDFLKDTDRLASPIFATVKVTCELTLNPNRTNDEVSELLRTTADTATDAGRTADLVRLGEIALQYRLDDVAKYVFEGAMPIAPYEAHRGLASLARRANKPDLLLTHLEAILDFSETDSNLIAEATYLRILLQKNLDRAALYAQGLVNRYPDNQQAKLLSAFASVRQNRTIDASIIINTLDSDKIEARFLPALAAVYDALGRTAEAERIVRRVDPATLSPPEKFLFQDINDRLN